MADREGEEDVVLWRDAVGAGEKRVRGRGGEQGRRGGYEGRGGEEGERRGQEKS